MEEGSSFRVTRRQFVGRGGAVVGALGLASLGWAPARLAAARPRGDRLTAARAGTYAALVGALALAPEAGVADPEQSRAAMEVWYASAPHATRAYIDSVLDSLDADTRGSFTAKPAPARLALLRRWVGARHGTLGAAAVTIAAPAIDADTDTPAASPDYLRA
jgi:hypothetical protein